MLSDVNVKVALVLAVALGDCVSVVVIVLDESVDVA